MKENKTIALRSKTYRNFIASIGSLFQEAREKAYSQVNQILTRTYWEIGRRIVEFEQKGMGRAKYGSKLLDKISADLTQHYGRGFSRDNLEKMRKFYLLFPNSETLSRKLSWSHYCLIFKLDNELTRKFYLKEVEKEGWSVRELDRQINSMLFERLALSKEPGQVLKLAEQGQLIEKTSDLIKDPYILEFLNLESSSFTETELEERIISNLGRFLLELGKGFMFVARQQRITIDGEHFFIDLVFYNRLLKCFVIIELKIGKLTHQDLGQLQMYVNYYDKEIKKKGENNTIGILLCADKKEAIVQYTLPKYNKHIFASKYKLYLPDKRMLKQKLKRLLE